MGSDRTRIVSKTKVSFSHVEFFSQFVRKGISAAVALPGIFVLLLSSALMLPL